MSKLVAHKQVYRMTFGGVINRTLCRRVSNAGDDMNIADDDAGVTCKNCLHLMKNDRLMARVARDQAEVDTYFKRH